MIITEQAINKLLPTNKERQVWREILNKVLPECNIGTRQRVAAFIAQTAHESMDYNRLTENLNYGTSGLMATWPSRFRTVDEANLYARQPEKIANKVYAGRLGNSSDVAVGDGWRYRGRGIMQITGKDNYRTCSKALYGDERLVEKPELLEQKDVALYSACWFWNSRNLSVLADRGEIDMISRKINGGEHGLKERARRFSEALVALGA